VGGVGSVGSVGFVGFKASVCRCKRTISEANSECVLRVFHRGRCTGAADGRLGDFVVLAVIVYDLLKLLAFTEVSCDAYIGRRSSEPGANWSDKC
jgi:hypothetical protein